MSATELLRLVPDAPAAVGRILDPARGPLERPNRSEIFGPQRFAQHGRSLGDTHRGALRADGLDRLLSAPARQHPHPARGAPLHRRAGDHRLRHQPGGRVAARQLPPDRSAAREIHDGLPRRYFRDLPVLQDEPLAGLPRVYGVAWAFVAHTDSAFDEELLVHFLSAYQETRELKLGELWALPTTLRVVLIENLRRLAERVAANKAAREVANLCSDRLETYPPAALDAVLALLNRRGVGRDVPGADRRSACRTRVRRRARPRPTGCAGVAPHLAEIQTRLPRRPGRRQPERRQRDHVAARDRRRRLAGDRRPAPASLMRLMLQLAGVRRRARRHPRPDPARDREAGARERPQRAGGRADAARADAGSADDAEPAPRIRRASPPTGCAAAGRTGCCARSACASRRPGGAGSAAPARPARLPRRGRAGQRRDGRLAAAAPQRRARAQASRRWLGVLAAMLMLLPASEAVVAVINRLISESARPQPPAAPRASPAASPPSTGVMVVIPAMLTEAGRRPRRSRTSCSCTTSPIRSAARSSRC